jgi:hypothetical protein
MLRHGGSGLAQRLHILLAFAVTAGFAWLATQLLSRRGPRELLANGVYLALGLLALQVLLGVESYLGKFAALGPQAQWLPEMRAVSRSQAMLRTGHQLIGCGLLATAAALALVASRWPLLQSYQQAMQEKEVPPVAAMAFDGSAEKIAEARLPDVALMALKPPPDDGLVR